MAKRTYNPCDDCKYNFSYNNQECLMCKICEFKQLLDEYTTDVVPKSEYYAVVNAVDNSTKEFLKLHDKYQEQEAEIERLTKILNSYALQYGTVKDQQSVINKAKAEVAREIFAEIAEKLEGLFDFFRQDDCIRESCAIMMAISEIAELKKKYTEGEPNG